MDLRKLKEIIQSSNINFLIGAGASGTYLSVLGNIEKAITAAKGNKPKILSQYKDYFQSVMYPCLSILENGTNLSTTKPPKAKPEDEDKLSDKERFDYTYKGYAELRIYMDQQLFQTVIRSSQAIAYCGILPTSPSQR